MYKYGVWLGKVTIFCYTWNIKIDDLGVIWQHTRLSHYTPQRFVNQNQRQKKKKESCSLCKVDNNSLNIFSSFFDELRCKIVSTACSSMNYFKAHLFLTSLYSQWIWHLVFLLKTHLSIMSQSCILTPFCGSIMRSHSQRQGFLLCISKVLITGAYVI